MPLPGASASDAGTCRHPGAKGGRRRIRVFAEDALLSGLALKRRVREAGMVLPLSPSEDVAQETPGAFLAWMVEDFLGRSFFHQHAFVHE